MAVVIASPTPSTGDFLSAYNPIMVTVYANQPTSGDPCKVVYCDVYLNNLYIGTYSSTVIHNMVGPYAEYHFDIQDKCQEYLRSNYLTGIGPTQNTVRQLLHSVSCYVKIRETDTDAGGFTISVGTAPVQGSIDVDPIGGEGTQSDIFYVLNTFLKHRDSKDLLTHLKKYTPSAYIFTDSGWALSHRPNEVPLWNVKLGSGKYWVGYNDHDFISFVTPDNLNTGTVYIGVYIDYLDGSSADDTIPFTSAPVGFPSPSNGCITYTINLGIPILSTYAFTGLTWTKIKSYTVYIFAPFIDYATQKYYVKNDGSKNERIRLFFVNLLGGLDGVNMLLTEEKSIVSSSEYMKTKDAWYPNRVSDRGTGRFQPEQSNVIECWTEDYPEEDRPWLDELVGTAQAYVQAENDNVQEVYDYVTPIVILDAEVVTKKKEDSFVYNLAVKFKYSNEVINLRS